VSATGRNQSITNIFKDPCTKGKLPLVEYMCIEKPKLEDAENIRFVILKAGETGLDDFDEYGWDFFTNNTDIESVRDRLEDTKYIILCYSLNKRIVGVIAIKELTKIDQLFVLPEVRRQGIARKLWEAARDISFAKGNTGGFSVKSSTLAIPVYEKFGFTVVGKRETLNGVRYTPMELAP
jgi:ribosomal protein S18 acetylase RimI-like enzyme